MFDLHNDGFGTGKMIEAYPEDEYTEKDHKQWGAAINYAILLGTADELDDLTKDKIGEYLGFASYGDYGKLTQRIQRVLDENNSFEYLCSNLSSCDTRYH